MSPKESSTPLAALDIRFPRPSRSFGQPRNLIAELWSKDGNTENTMESTPTNYAEVSGTASLFADLVKLLPEESANLTKQILDAVVKSTAAVKGAPLWVTATTEGWNSAILTKLISLSED